MPAIPSKDPHWICKENGCGQINQFSREVCIACGATPIQKVDHMRQMQIIAGKSKWNVNKGSLL